MDLPRRRPDLAADRLSGPWHVVRGQNDAGDVETRCGVLVKVSLAELRVKFAGEICSLCAGARSG